MLSMALMCFWEDNRQPERETAVSCSSRKAVGTLFRNISTRPSFLATDPPAAQGRVFQPLVRPSVRREDPGRRQGGGVSYTKACRIGTDVPRHVIPISGPLPVARTRTHTQASGATSDLIIFTLESPSHGTYSSRTKAVTYSPTAVPQSTISVDVDGEAPGGRGELTRPDPIRRRVCRPRQEMGSKDRGRGRGQSAGREASSWG